MEPDDPRLTFGRFLADAARRHGERTAIRFDDRTLTYAEVDRDARQLARALVGAGVVKGARVAVWMANRPEWIVSAFAVGMVGGVLVPVNTFASASERDYILRHSDASLLLMQPSLKSHDFAGGLLTDHPEIPAARPGRIRCAALPQLRRVACFGVPASQGGFETFEDLYALAEDVDDALVEAACAEVEPPDDGVLIYTSGTTAHPKGVLHTQRAGILQGWRFAEIMDLGPDDRVFTTYPFFWTAGIAMSLTPVFAVGAMLLVQEVFDAGPALEVLERERATAIHAWPHQHQALAEHPSAATRDLSALEKLDVTSPLAKIVGVEKDEYSTSAAYGLSETFTIASMLPARAPPEIRRQSSGRALPGTILRIVDPVTGEPLPPGRAGEIAVKGVTLMRGYYKVLPEHVLDEDGFFRTQDGGSQDEAGHLHWTGRLGNLIKTGGANVSPVEIEEALARYPGMKVGMPVGIGHPTLGQIVVLCAVPVQGATLDEGEIRAFLRQRLAAFKVPKRVLFFREDELSYTGNQKIQVAPLAEAALAKLEAEEAEIDGYRYVADEGRP